MLKNRYAGLAMAIVLGAFCSGMGCFSANAATDFTYQSLTNLGPCASSRVLLMNNDTNPTCPILGQGYHDTSNTVEVGQTYWWHDDTPCDEMIGTTPISDLVNLQIGSRHILYHKQSADLVPVKLWELVNCRAGSSAMKLSANFNYLPWSSTCQPIDAGTYSSPIADDWDRGSFSNGVRQVAVITMRASRDSAIYSPFYEEGIGEIYFDAVNFTKAYVNSHIAVEIATEAIDGTLDGEAPGFYGTTDASKLKWVRMPCEVFSITKGGACTKDPASDGMTEVRLSGVSGYDNQFYRLRVNVNHRGAIRFRIIRTDI